MSEHMIPTAAVTGVGATTATTTGAVTGVGATSILLLVLLLLVLL